ncbi:MAG: hypothetical protein AB7T31_06115 [Gemmatimonadales bacterium]
MSTVRPLILLAACTCFASALAAQVSIRVVDANGAPVPAVRVDVYGRGEVIGQAATAADGIAVLGAERWAEARRLSLTHLGYQTLIVQVEEIPADGVIAIEPDAIPLDALSVEVGQLCPIVDEPEARRLWSAVASLYATDTGSRAPFAYLSLHRGRVREDELYRRSDVETLDGVTNGGWGALAGGDLFGLTVDEQIEQAGYAWPPFTIDGPTLRANGWGYPALDMRAAHHFASAVFGARHDFAVVSASEEKATLAFCGNGRGPGPTIQGTITLTPGRAFLGAEWRFETPEPDEGAGGSVTFSTFVDRAGSRPHLVSSRGMFYRHSGVEPPYPALPRTYEREITENVRWYLLPSGESPCTGNVSFPASADPALAACVERYWGRE